MFEFRRAARLFAVSAMLVPLAMAGQATSAAQPNDSPEARAAAMIRPAIVYIETKFSGWVIDENGTALNNGDPFDIVARCTGFAVKSDGYIGTAGHCVDADFQRGEIIRFAAQGLAADRGETVDQLVEFGTANWTVEGQKRGTLPDTEVMVSGAGQRGVDVKPLPARILDLRPLGEGDVALLKVELGNKIIPSAELSQADEPQVGDPILSVGYPASTENVTDFSLEPTVKSGTVSAKETWQTQPIFQVSAPMTQGMSGGPTVDLHGQVIGLNSFSPVGEQQAFNYIAPVQGLKELLARNGVQAGLSPADNAFRAGLDGYFTGKYSDAIAGFDRTLELSPQYPGAFDMRTDAARLLAQSGNAGGSSGVKPWMFIAGFVAVAALVGGGVLVFALSRRDKQPALAGGGGWPADAGSAAPRQPNVNAARPPVGAAAPIGQGGGGAAAAPPPPPPPSDAGGSTCRNCGFALAPGAGFCPRCGKPQR
jgi:serine protease Do